MYTTIILAGKYFGFHAIMTMNQKACCGDNTPGYTDHNKMETLNYIFDQFKFNGKSINETLAEMNN